MYSCRHRRSRVGGLLHGHAAPPLDLFFHDATTGSTVSTDFTNEPAGEDARARKQLADHAFCPWRAGCVLFVHERVAACQ